MQLITHRYLFVCFCLFVCLFVCFTTHSRIFHSYGDVTVTDEGLQIWPMLARTSCGILLVSCMLAAVIWPKYCRYGVKHYIINQSISYVDVKSNFNRDMSHVDWINSNIEYFTLLWWYMSACCIYDKSGQRATYACEHTTCLIMSTQSRNIPQYMLNSMHHFWRKCSISAYIMQKLM